MVPKEERSLVGATVGSSSEAFESTAGSPHPAYAGESPIQRVNILKLNLIDIEEIDLSQLILPLHTKLRGPFLLGARAALSLDNVKATACCGFSCEDVQYRESCQMPSWGPSTHG